MSRLMLMAAGCVLALCCVLEAHDPSAAPITWNREVSRIVFDRCASCHREGGTSFTLMTFKDAQPRAIAMKEAVLSRRMPPWGAVKGFGHFRNDQGMTQEELALISDWVEGGMVKGNNPNTLPPAPKFEAAARFRVPGNAIAVSGNLTLGRAVTLDGLIPKHVPLGASLQVVATLPDGGIEPLVWLHEYKDNYRHPFLFRKLIVLPAGSVIRGVTGGATILLIPASGTHR